MHKVTDCLSLVATGIYRIVNINRDVGVIKETQGCDIPP